MIELINICKSYGERKIFENFNVKITSGEFVIFSGESGSGKTTLLNIIGGLENIDSGKVVINGSDISKTKTKNKIKYFQNEVGFLFQNFGLIDSKTVAQNLNIVKKKEKGLSITNVLDTVGLSGYENRKVFSLSGGEQQRIALARLMLKKCNLILADEPTGSLDRNNAEKVISILNELNKQGKTIVMVTHDQKFKDMGMRVIDIK
jgi:putative ABC transport system ATP-binding protein